MSRTALTIGVFAVAALFAAAFLTASDDTPCRPDTARTAALVVSALLFGVGAYLTTSRRTAARWIPLAALVATAVVAYYAIAILSLLFFSSCLS